MTVVEKLSRELCRKFGGDPDEWARIWLGHPWMIQRWKLYEGQARRLLGLVDHGPS